MHRNFYILIGIAVIAVAYIWATRGNVKSDIEKAAGDPIVSINLPANFSDRAIKGRLLFEENCTSCHGKNAVGQDGVAPPLVHKIYEPSHHGDESFQRAVALGVKGHHWPFGNMPTVEGLDRQMVTDIIAYVRELQRANGIF